MEDKKIEQLKKRRRCQRAQITKSINQIEEFKEGPESELKLNSLKVQLTSKREELRKLDDEIIAAVEIDTELASEVDNSETYQYNIIEGIQKIELTLRKQKEKLEANKESTDATIHKTPQLTTRLPKIELPKFNGNILNWISFWQTFEATIHQRKDLTDIEKLNYLISLLQEDAARTIEGFAITAENYEDVIKVLKERYGDQERILDHHIRKLLSLKPVKEIAHLKDLRRLITDISIHLRSLNNLNLPSSHNKILHTKIKDLVPEEIMLIYERQINDGRNSTEELMNFLQNEVNIREKTKSSVILDPTAPIFRPRSGISQNWRRSPFFVPRVRMNGLRPWTPRVPNQQTQRMLNQQRVPVAPENNRVVCHNCKGVGHYSRDCATVKK